MKQSKQRFLVPLLLSWCVCFCAQAIEILEPAQIHWTGTCLDCTEPLGSESPAHATLDVMAVGNAGGGSLTDISAAFGFGNLVGFSYWSALFPYGLFAVPGGISFATGEIPVTGPSMADTTIVFDGVMGYEGGGVGGLSSWMFWTSAGGRWELARATEDALIGYDVGIDSVFGAVDVPAPGTLVLLVIGLAASGYQRKTKH